MRKFIKIYRVHLLLVTLTGGAVSAGEPAPIEKSLLDSKLELSRQLHKFYPSVGEVQNNLFRLNETVAINSYFRMTLLKHQSALDTLVAIGKFTGFAEAKLCDIIPSWWTNSLLISKINLGAYAVNAEYRRRDFSIGLSTVSPPRYKISSDFLMDGERELIPVAVLTKIKAKSDKYIELARLDDCLFVVFYSDSVMPLTLYRIELKTGKILFKSTVWANEYRFASGAPLHCLSLSLTKAKVSIFGIEPGSAYIEQFDITSGKPALRFSSSIWMQD